MALPAPSNHVKRLLHRIRSTSGGGSASGGDTGGASGFFGSMFDEDSATSTRAVWSERSTTVEASVVDRHEGRTLLERVLLTDPPAVELSRDELNTLLGCFHFAAVASGREIISQDERGDYLLVVLDGVISVDRVQLWGDRVGLGEARRGDVLGEMSLLDAGPRFSSCTTLKECRVAVLEAAALDRMLRDHPRVALALVTMLARRLSLRLRHVSTRLTALLVRR